jgi:hypothetical protein
MLGHVRRYLWLYYIGWQIMDHRKGLRITEWRHHGLYSSSEKSTGHTASRARELRSQETWI